MPCSHDAVVDNLLRIHDDIFAGKENQRFIIAMDDLRKLYGLQRFSSAKFQELVEKAYVSGLYLLDLGTSNRGRLVAVIKADTLDRWRKVPKKIVKMYTPSDTLEKEPLEDEEYDEDE